MKMSDFPKGAWQGIWDGLFWHFMDKQRAFFLKNPRLGMLVRTFDQMAEDKKQQHIQTAMNFLQGLSS
jgi:deoxyribodipyrimidine photolyase-related protein